MQWSSFALFENYLYIIWEFSTCIQCILIISTSQSPFWLLLEPPPCSPSELNVLFYIYIFCFIQFHATQVQIQPLPSASSVHFFFLTKNPSTINYNRINTKVRTHSCCDSDSHVQGGKVRCHSADIALAHQASCAIRDP